MSGKANPDWHPLQGSALSDQCNTYDKLRESCPVAFSDFFQWSVFRHSDVKKILLDHEQFSNQVSSRVSVPNGMDPPEHTPYRTIIEPYFSPERMAAFKPVCQEISAQLLDNISEPTLNVVTQLAEPFALRIQCAFMGWPLSLQEQLIDWSRRNQRAILAEDKAALARYGIEFEEIVENLIEERKTLPADSSADITTQLMNETVNGRKLDHQELVSLLRNWTVGEIGTIAASISIIVHFLASHPELQQQLREKPEKLWYANDEILRLHNPLVDNRRKTNCPVTLQNRDIPAGSRLTLNWIAANRDPEVFDQAGEFSWNRNESQNLLYGMGVHVCPGAPLARMELVIIIRRLLQNTNLFTLDNEKPAVLATYPASGYAELSIKIG